MTVRRSPHNGEKRILITGGCGFLGCNIANALAANGRNVVILDSLARSGAETNAQWLKTRHGEKISIKIGDVRDKEIVDTLVKNAEAVLHLAAQVAVTTSLDAPVDDFEINARGTLNVLEAVRVYNSAAPVIFASTNKVYGEVVGADALDRCGARYAPNDPRLASGIDETAPLDFYSPYGCSKGSADQYIRDYARVFGLRTAVFRMSCIYGPRQFGTEDQGWIAHFLLQAIRGEPITIFGDGCQVRDALFVGDAVAAWLAALNGIDAVRGCVFNLGGGTGNSISLLELIDAIAHLNGERPQTTFEDWRPGDQRWYVSDISRAAELLNWAPRVSLKEGLCQLSDWLGIVREKEHPGLALRRVRA